MSPPSPITTEQASRRRSKASSSFLHGDDFAGEPEDPHALLAGDRRRRDRAASSAAPPGHLAGARIRVTGVAERTPSRRRRWRDDRSRGRRRAATDLGRRRIASRSCCSTSPTTPASRTPQHSPPVSRSTTPTRSRRTTPRTRGAADPSGRRPRLVHDPEHERELRLLDVGDRREHRGICRGVNLGGYDNVVYAFPTTSCGWAGLGQHARQEFVAERPAAHDAARDGPRTGPQLRDPPRQPAELHRGWRTRRAPATSRTARPASTAIRSASWARRRGISTRTSPGAITAGWRQRTQSPRRRRGTSCWPRSKSRSASAVTSLCAPANSSSWLTIEFRQPYRDVIRDVRGHGSGGDRSNHPDHARATRHGPNRN